MNETISQLIDSVRTVQQDQSNLTVIIDKLATKVNNLMSSLIKVELIKLINIDIHLNRLITLDRTWP